VRHVVAGAREFGEQNVPCHDHVFGAAGDAAHAQPRGLDAFVHVAARAEIQVLAVLNDGETE